jgi:hypothetical protein
MQGCKEAGIPAFGTLWDFVGVVFFAIFQLLQRLTVDKVIAVVTFIFVVPCAICSFPHIK